MLGEKLGDGVRGEKQRPLAARGISPRKGEGHEVFFNWGEDRVFFWGGCFFVVLGLGLGIILEVYGGFCWT